MRALLLVCGLVAASAAGAQSLPTNCTFPQAVDQLASVQPGDQLTSAMFNQMRCVLNRLQTRSLESGAGELACGAVTLPPGSRSLVTLTMPSAVPANAAVQVTPRDDAAPGMLTAEAQAPSGASVPVWVWNHDADTSRSGVVCAHVVRP